MTHTQVTMTPRPALNYCVLRSSLYASGVLISSDWRENKNMSCLPVCQCAVGETQTVTKDSSTVHLQYMSFPSSWYPEVLFNLTTCWHGEHSRKGISEGHWAGINLIPDEIAPHPHPCLTCERMPDTDARHCQWTWSRHTVTHWVFLSQQHWEG